MNSYFSRPYTFDRVVRLVISLVVVVCLFLAVKYLSAVLLPFFVAWLFAYLFQPFVDFLQRYLHSRTASILTVILLIVLTIVGFVCFMVPTFISEFLKLKDLLIANGSIHSSLLPKEWTDYIVRLAGDAGISEKLSLSGIIDMLVNMFPHAWSLLSNTMAVFKGVVGLIFVLVYLFFILRDQDSIAVGFVKLLPKHYKGVGISLMRDLKQGMSLYFRRQAIIAFIDAFLFAVGFYAIGMPMGVVMGVLLGALNMVPYMQYLGLPPAALLMLIKATETNASIGMALLLMLIVFLLVQVIQDFYLIPRIMGKSMGMNPAVVLLSLSVWGYVLGVIGMIIALPATTILISYYKHYFLKENMRHPFGGADDEAGNVSFSNTTEHETD